MEYETGFYLVKPVDVKHGNGLLYYNVVNRGNKGGFNTVNLVTGGVERLDLARALGAVPREARLLLALHYVDGLSYRELARIRGISVNTVKSQLARGKAILRRALED